MNKKINWKVILSKDNYIYHLYIFKNFYKKYFFSPIFIDPNIKSRDKDIKIKLFGFLQIQNPFFYTDIDIFINIKLLNLIFDFINKNKEKNYFLNTLDYSPDKRVPCSVFYIYELNKFKKTINQSLKSDENFIYTYQTERLLYENIFRYNSIDLFELADFSYVIIEKPFIETKEKKKIYQNFFNKNFYFLFKKNSKWYKDSNIAFLIPNFSKEKVIRIL